VKSPSMTAELDARTASPAEVRRPDPVDRWPAGRLPLVLTATVMFVVGCVGAGDPSPWRDEAATIVAAGRPLPSLFRLLGNLDAVHGAYYLLMHPVVSVFGTNEVVVRMPAVLASAATAAGVTALGRRLTDPVAGLTAGLAYAGAPMVTRYAQEARGYAMVCGMAVLSTWLVLNALEGRGRRPLFAYGLSLVVLGLLNVFSLLILAPHALLVWNKRLAVQWTVTVGSAVAVLSPLLWLAYRQKDQVAWIMPPTGRDVLVLGTSLAGSALMSPLVALLATAGLWRASRLRAVVLPWLVVPPAILLTVSLIHPCYTFRYVILCLPAVALAVGAGIRRIPLWPRVLVVVALIALSIPAHVELRRQDSRMEDLTAVASILRKRSLPGDGLFVMVMGHRRMLEMYPGIYRRLQDVTLAATPESTGDFIGKRAPRPVVVDRLRGLDRLWLWRSLPMPRSRANGRREVRGDWNTVRLAGGFSKADEWHVKGGTLMLYVRQPGFHQGRATPKHRRPFS